MANEINGLDSRPVSVGAGRAVARAPDASTGGPQSQPAASTGDVHITDSANKLASLEQALREMPAVDDARVTQVRNALAEGSYTIQPRHIAEKLLSLEQSLGQLPDPEQSGEQAAAK